MALESFLRLDEGVVGAEGTEKPQQLEARAGVPLHPEQKEEARQQPRLAQIGRARVRRRADEPGQRREPGASVCGARVVADKFAREGDQLGRRRPHRCAALEDSLGRRAERRGADARGRVGEGALQRAEDARCGGRHQRAGGADERLEELCGELPLRLARVAGRRSAVWCL